MKILISNCSFHNLGDVLMLESVIKICKDQFENCEFYLDGGGLNINSPVVERHNINIINIPIDNYFPNYFLINRIVNKLYRLWYNEFESIDYVFDVNGYFLSEKWGSKNVLRKVLLYETLKERGAKLILMPMSIGPYSENFKKMSVGSYLLNLSDIAFARDPDSYKHASRLMFNNDTLKLSSDYTYIPATPKKLSIGDHKKNQVAIIPNYRMLETYGWDRYISFLKKIKYILDENNLRYYLLIHDYKNDIKLLKNESFKELFNIDDIVKSNDPLILKEYSKNASLVISSRYHGILNALNNFRPVIGTSWSHKYEFISEEYRMEEYLLDIDEEKKVIREKVLSALNNDQYHIRNSDSIARERHNVIKKIKEEISRIS